MAERELHTLSAALQRFASCNRYNFLKTLQVGRFLQEGPVSLGVLSEFTFEKLVELGTKKIAKLRWLSPEQEERLVTLLQALCDGEETFQSLPPPRARPAEPSAEASSDDEQFGSVEVELELRRVIKDLKASPHFERIGSLPLGHFWDPKWPRAPFEEAITVGQLAEIDLTTLMKKRTMNNRRIKCMGDALKTAFSTLVDDGGIAVGSSSKASEPVLLSTRRPFLRLEPARGHQWHKEAGAVPALSKAGAEHFLMACEAAANAPGRIERLLASVPHSMSLTDFLLLSGSSPIGEGTRRKLESWRSSETFLQGAGVFRSALQGPGVRISALAAAVDQELFSPANAELGCLVVARALGAVEVRVGRAVCAGLWTLNPLLAGELVKIAKRRGEDSEEALRSMCPDLDDGLRSWLLGLARGRTKTPVRTRRKNSPR